MPVTASGGLPRLANFIGGEQAAPAEPAAWSTVRDPCTGRPAFEVPLSRRADADRAFASAAKALPAWSGRTPGERAGRLLALAGELDARVGELAALDSADTGKRAEDVARDEIGPAVDQLRLLAGAARSPAGVAAGEYERGHTSSVRREPVGVCLLVTPWNLPLAMALWKAAPALAAGNTAVVKPAETTPRSTLLLAEAAARHLGPGVLDVLCGDRETGRIAVAHPEPALVALTGSTRAGREAAAAAGLKRLHLELGGNSAAVVFDDVDVARTAARLADAAFLNAGQDCVAAARLLVHESVCERFTAELVRRAAALVPGAPDDPRAGTGPLNNADQLARLEGLIGRLPAGARVRAGGRRAGREGYFFQPTVITGVAQGDEIVQEEVFGPVATVQPFRDAAEALRLADGVDQGLACSVWTNRIAEAEAFAGAVRAGCVWVNTHLAFASEMPHGGFKSSGFGKDLSVYALDGYSEIKHVMIAHGPA